MIGASWFSVDAGGRRAPARGSYPAGGAAARRSAGFRTHPAIRMRSVLTASSLAFAVLPLALPLALPLPAQERGQQPGQQPGQPAKQRFSIADVSRRVDWN